MKIYLSNLNESWIVDRIREEWYKYNPEIHTKLVYRSDIIWIIAPWLWKKIPKKQLSSKKLYALSIILIKALWTKTSY